MRFTTFALTALALAACHNSALGDGSAASAELSSGVAKTSVGTNPGNAGRGTPLTPQPGHELAAFAEGCFWGSENTFRHVPGVVATAVGYTGGTTKDPTYETVCTHTTAHAETVLIEYDPKVVTYTKLLGVFFRSHDPSQRDRQGPDVGDQYRSEIFTFSPLQATEAKNVMQAFQTEAKKNFATKIEAIGQFWKAEEYHQQYDEKTGRESCPLPRVLGT